MKFKPGKITAIILISIAVLLISIFFAISPVAKYMIEKNSEEWTGRKITMNSLFINLLKWDITVKGLIVYERKSDSVFFGTARLYTAISLPALIKGEYFIKTIQLVAPNIVIEQYAEHFNYDDLVTRFTAADTKAKQPEEPSQPLKYRVENIEITEGTITYRDKVMQLEAVLQQFKMGCPLLVWNSPDVNAATSFTLKSGGTAEARISLNLDSLSYLMKSQLVGFNLELLTPYTKDFLKTSYAGGLLGCDLLIKGDFDIPEAVALKGDISLSQMRLDDAAKVTVASWKDFRINIDSLDVAGNIYDFGKITLEEPYIFFELFDTTDNFSKMMVGSGTESVMDTTAAVDEVDYSNPFTIMADYIKQISKDYIISNYTAADVVIRNGHILYKDYTLEDKFVYDLEHFEMSSGRIDSKSDSVTIDISCLTNRSGTLKAHLAFDPRDYMDMSVNYSIEKMRVSDFNPYTRFYVAHAFVEGMLFYHSTNTIKNGKLKSTNLLSIKKIEVSRKLKGMGIMEVPLRLAIAILRDRKGNIELDIPVEGDLKDPEYKLGKVIWQIVKNLLVKVATAPFDLLANAFGCKEEDIKYVRFDYLQKQFDDHQVKNLAHLGNILSEKPELKINMVQVASRDLEKEALALSLAKATYYKTKIMPSPKDSLDAGDLKAIADIPNKDLMFNTWLNERFLPEDVSGMPSQLKCLKLYGDPALAMEINNLFSTRNKMIMDYLVNEKKIDSTRIKITNTADEKSAEFESTPRFTVELYVEE